MRARRRAAVGAGALVVGLVLTASPAAATGPAVEVVVSGLSDPWSVRFDAKGRILVAENGTGELTRVAPWDPGHQEVLAVVPGLAAADARGRTLLALTSGQGAPDAPALEGAATLSAGPRGHLRPLADLLAHELAENPDGQVQLVDGRPVDALSNPFSVLATRGHHRIALVADGGGNDVLAVSRDGSVSTFFVPPTVDTGACAGAENNPGTSGCDAVPTGLAQGPDGLVYVAALTADVPGEGRVYVVDRDGCLVREIGGFSGPTGVAVGDDGTVYVSELQEGAPKGEGPPPAGFDPSSVGRIVAVAPDGRRSAAQVTLPLGLQWHDGALYSTAGSVLGAFAGPDAPPAAPAGAVVRLRPSAFSPL